MGCATDQAGLAFSESSSLGARFEYRQRDPEGKVLFRVVHPSSLSLRSSYEGKPEFDFDHPAIAPPKRPRRGGRRRTNDE
jgi:hypothetical protein